MDRRSLTAMIHGAEVAPDLKDSLLARRLEQLAGI